MSTKNDKIEYVKFVESDVPYIRVDEDNKGDIVITITSHYITWDRDELDLVIDIKIKEYFKEKVEVEPNYSLPFKLTAYSMGMILFYHLYMTGHYIVSSLVIVLFILFEVMEKEFKL